MDVLGCVSLTDGPYDLCERQRWTQELCESRGGRHWLPVPDGPYDLRGRKTTLDDDTQ